MGRQTHRSEIRSNWLNWANKKIHLAQIVKNQEISTLKSGDLASCEKSADIATLMCILMRQQPACVCQWLPPTDGVGIPLLGMVPTSPCCFALHHCNYLGPAEYEFLIPNWDI